MKKQPITLPGLIEALTPAAVAKALEVDTSLPYKWRDGSMPKRANEAALKALAKRNGYNLTMPRVRGAR